MRTLTLTRSKSNTRNSITKSSERERNSVTTTTITTTTITNTTNQNCRKRDLKASHMHKNLHWRVVFGKEHNWNSKLINTRSLFYQHTYTQSKHPSIPESFLSLHPRVVVSHDANTHTHTRKRTFLGRFKLHSNTHTHTHVHMLARRLSSKQAAVVCVKARRISFDQRRPDLFRTRLCSNKWLLCYMRYNFPARKRKLCDRFVQNLSADLAVRTKMATCSVKIRPCLLNFSNKHTHKSFHIVKRDHAHSEVNFAEQWRHSSM